MPKQSNLRKLKIFERKTVSKVASYHLRFFKHRVIEEGKDATGARFRPYSAKYRKLKARGFKKKDGTNYKSVAQKSVSTQVFPPNFRLTGDTMGSLHVRNPVDTDGYYLEWTSPDAGPILKGNKQRGRDIISDIPQRELKKVRVYLEKQFGKHARRVLNKTINIRVG